MEWVTCGENRVCSGLPVMTIKGRDFFSPGIIPTALYFTAMAQETQTDSTSKFA
jgi:hypothetical protein